MAEVENPARALLRVANHHPETTLLSKDWQGEGGGESMASFQETDSYSALWGKKGLHPTLSPSETGSPQASLLEIGVSSGKGTDISL